MLSSNSAVSSSSPTSQTSSVSTAQPVLYWCARNMSFWSSISFNLAVLMNLLVAFFYPFKGVRGGNRIFISFETLSRSTVQTSLEARILLSCFSLLLTCCLPQDVYCCDKHYDRRQRGEGKVCLSLCFHITVHQQRKSRQEPNKAEVMAQCYLLSCPLGLLSLCF